MSLKAYNNGIQVKEIRCVDAGGVERIIREIRKGDVQWWKGESDPPSINGTWTKVADGLYQTKAIIPSSYTTPNFLKDGVNTNYVIVSFHSYENTVTCEFFGDFEGVAATPSTNGLDGEFYVTYSWADASGTGLQSYKCRINVFPEANGNVTLCKHSPANSEPMFTEDSAFVSAYGDGWVVQGTAAHNKMCSDAFDYYTDKTVFPWGMDGRYNNIWFNENGSSGVTNYICSDNGRVFSVKVLSGSVSLVFCPPGGSAAGWVASKDSRFPSSSGWYQKTKKDGYTKFFNTSTGRFAEYLPKESFRSHVLDVVRSSIGSNLSASEYANRVVCTDFNATHLETSSKVAERKTNSYAVSEYDTEYYYDVYGIPLVNLTTGAYIFGHYNPSAYSEFTIDTTSCRYTSLDGILFNSVITMTFSNGNSTIGLELNQQDIEFRPNTFLTGTYPKANYMYDFDMSHTEYISLIIACIADNKSDVVGDFHEYRLPASASYELKSISFSANGILTSFTPANGYVLGTGYFTEKDSTFTFVIRPSSLVSTYYHRIIFNHTNVSTSSNSKALEISANLSYFGTTTYSNPQNSLAEDRKLVPAYWSMGAAPEDRPNSFYDGSRYMTSSILYCRITLTCDWDPKGETFTNNWWWAKYVLPIATDTPMTVAKATFMCYCINKYHSLPGIGYLDNLGINLSIEIHNASQSQIGNSVFTITMDRSTGVVLVSSTAKENLPRVGENIYTYSRFYEDDVRYLMCIGHPDGDILLDMYTGEWDYW